MVEADAEVDRKAAEVGWSREDLTQFVSLLCSWLRAHEESFRDLLSTRLFFKLLSKLLGQEKIQRALFVREYSRLPKAHFDTSVSFA